MFLAGGAKLLGEGFAERGKGVGARRVGEGGGGKGGGVRGWNLYLNEIFYKTGIVSSDKGVVTHVTTRNRTWNRGESPFSEGIPMLWHHNLAKMSRSRPRKVRKRDVREISPHYLCKKEQPSLKTEKNASLRNFQTQIY